MALKKRRPRRRRAGKRRGKSAKSRFRFGRSLAILALLLVVAGGVAVAWFDHQLTERFRQRHLAPPAHVYSRPVEWFPGTPLDRKGAVDVLKALGYRESGGDLAPGGFRVGASSVELHTRAFEYSGDLIEPRRVRVEIAQGGIRRISSATENADMAVLMLDPVPIGSLASDSHEDRKVLRLHQVPETFLQVLLMVEDRQFMSHLGIDPAAVLRALWHNLASGGVTQGGSTISQQLVKNLYLSPERTLGRKLKEALYAILLEWHFDKHEILQAYINEVFLAQAGNRAIHGFGLASEYFFGRPLSKLELQDYALLVGMVKAPSAYNPRRNPARARQRRDVVLRVLAEGGLIDEAQRAALSKKPLGVIEAERGGTQSYAGFIDLVRRQVAERGIESIADARDLKIWSTMDPSVQVAAERALAEGLARIEKQRGIPGGTLQGAVVVLRAENGQVLALVGDRRRDYAGFNRALDARRPVGSLLKPFIALTALESPRGYHLASPLDDTEFSLKLKNGSTWTPGNYDETFHGVVPMITAMENSYNVASARLGVSIGVAPFVNRLSQIALDEKPPAYPSALLGALELSPLEVSRLYLPLASGGLGFPVRAYVTATEENRRVVSRNPATTSRLISPDVHFLTHFLLRGVVERGTASAPLERLSNKVALAGKTGTTDDYRDSWFAGYSGNYLAVVWVGRDDNRPTGLSGSTGALPIWRDLMESLPLRPAEFDVPASIEWHRVDLVSGRRVGPTCDTALQMPFIKGVSPGRGRCGAQFDADERDDGRFRGWLKKLFSSGDSAPSEPWREGGRR